MTLLEQQHEVQPPTPAVYICAFLVLVLTAGCLYYCRKLIVFLLMLYLIYYLTRVYLYPYVKENQLL